MLRGGAAPRGADFATVFRWLFAAAAVFLAAGLVAVLVIEERPLRGPQQAPRRVAAVAAHHRVIAAPHWRPLKSRRPSAMLLCSIERRIAAANAFAGSAAGLFVAMNFSKAAARARARVRMTSGSGGPLRPSAPRRRKPAATPAEVAAAAARRARR